ncbi:MAG: S8 family serine peptidase [Phycisphaerales bacterium]
MPAGVLTAMLLAATANAGGPATPATVRVQARDAWVAPVGPESAGARNVWVYFSDKGVPAAELAASLRQLEQSSDPHMVARRRLRRTEPGLFDARDLPVCGTYLDQIRARGASVHVTSRWLNAASVRATAAQREQIAANPHVVRIEPVRAGRRHEPLPAENPAVPAPQSAAPRGAPLEGIAFSQQNQIGLPALHAAGFTGQGVRIGILDTGFKRTHAAFNQPGHGLCVIAEHDFVFNDGNTTNEPDDDPNQHNHGSYVLGLIGAYQPTVYTGGAFDACFILCKTEDIRSETPIEEDNYVAGLEFIEMHGGDIATASLGYIDWYTQADLDGQTAVTTVAVNVATANGLICFNAAGNEGHDADPGTSSIIAPADAHEVLTIGAVDSAGDIAGFSSDGPTADGRIKPEVLARGVNNDIIRVGNDTDFTNGSGTSFATPLAAAAGACLLQAHPTWSVSQMRAYLCATASDYVASGAHDPVFVRGFGIIAAAAAVMQDCNANGIDDAAEIASGQVADCNADGVPDPCEVALGPLAFFSADADQNGVPDECPMCPADYNHDGVVTSQDFFNFIADFFSASADFNHDGSTTSQDFFDFLGAFFTPC